MSLPLRCGGSRYGLTAGDADRAILHSVGRLPAVIQALTNPPTRRLPQGDRVDRNRLLGEMSDPRDRAGSPLASAPAAFATASSGAGAVQGREGLRQDGSRSPRPEAKTSPPPRNARARAVSCRSRPRSRPSPPGSRPPTSTRPAPSRPRGRRCSPHSRGNLSWWRIRSARRPAATMPNES